MPACRMGPWSFADTPLYLPKTNTLSPTREDSLLLMDKTMTDGQMTHVKVSSHTDYCDIR